MRKRRAIIFDDEPVVLDVLRLFFEFRGYETMLFRQPVVCPVYGNHTECLHLHPCGDIIVTDFKMPKMNGIELLIAQTTHGCKVPLVNKAVLSGYLDDHARESLAVLGVAYFQKPLDFNELTDWVCACEQRMDLSQPLGIKRREARHACSVEIRYGTPPAGGELYTGTTVNLSVSGICMKTKRALEPRQVISIHTQRAHTPQEASVRWVKENGEGAFLVGLTFTAS